MKESIVTGKYIYDMINRLEKEVKEIEKACDAVDEVMGEGSLPFKLLIEQRNMKNKELSSLYKNEYTIKPQSSLPLFDF